MDDGKNMTWWGEVFSGTNRLRSHEFPTDQGDWAQAKREEDELMALVDDLAADNDRLRAENERLRRRLREHGLPVDLVEPPPAERTREADVPDVIQALYAETDRRIERENALPIDLTRRGGMPPLREED